MERGGHVCLTGAESCADRVTYEKTHSTLVLFQTIPALISQGKGPLGLTLLFYLTLAPKPCWEALLHSLNRWLGSLEIISLASLDIASGRQGTLLDPSFPPSVWEKPGSSLLEAPGLAWDRWWFFSGEESCTDQAEPHQFCKEFLFTWGAQKNLMVNLGIIILPSLSFFNCETGTILIGKLEGLKQWTWVKY